MTIVCATRFSQESQHAVDAAAALARKKGASLSLVHVMPSGVLKTFSRSMAESAKKALDEEVRRLSEGGLTVTADVLSGKLDESLSRFCKERGARLLVVGDSTQRASMLLAGNLDKLAYSVEAPLLVVRDARPFEQWGKRPLRVMMAFDQTAASAVARDWIARLSGFGPIELLAAQIVWPVEEYEERALKPPAVDEGHLGLRELLQRELEAEFSALPPNVKVTLRLEVGAGNVADQLIGIASDAAIELMILGTHRRRALERLFSVSHRILLQAPMAVVCVPSTTTVPHLARSPAWKRGLVVTDFTEAGSRAVAWAASILHAGSTLNVLHVAAAPFSAGGEAALAEQLAESLPPDVEASGVRVVAHVQHGDPEVVVRNLALSLDVDVIVIGARELPDFEEAEVGVIDPRITEQWAMVQTLLEKTHRPVLLTPPLRT
jgi:nucleotide-binding universal stress UspA family protein